jgi:hypothetical protein
VSSSRSRSPAVNASSASVVSSPAASARTRTRRWPKSSGDTLPPDSSAIRTCSVDTRVARPNIFACPMRMSVDQGARRARGRAGAVPLRHLPDRLHGCRVLQHPSRRHDRRVGLRARRTIRDSERVSARRRTSDRDRYRPRSPRASRRAAARRRSTTARRTSTSDCASSPAAAVRIHASTRSARRPTRPRASIPSSIA